MDDINFWLTNKDSNDTTVPAGDTAVHECFASLKVLFWIIDQNLLKLILSQMSKATKTPDTTVQDNDVNEKVARNFITERIFQYNETL